MKNAIHKSKGKNVLRISLSFGIVKSRMKFISISSIRKNRGNAKNEF